MLIILVVFVLITIVEVLVILVVISCLVFCYLDTTRELRFWRTDWHALIWKIFRVLQNIARLGHVKNEWFIFALVSKKMVYYLCSLS